MEENKPKIEDVGFTEISKDEDQQQKQNEEKQNEEEINKEPEEKQAEQPKEPELPKDGTDGRKIEFPELSKKIRKLPKEDVRKKLAEDLEGVFSKEEKEAETTPYNSPPIDINREANDVDFAHLSNFIWTTIDVLFPKVPKLFNKDIDTSSLSLTAAEKKHLIAATEPVLKKHFKSTIPVEVLLLIAIVGAYSTKVADLVIQFEQQKRIKRSKMAEQSTKEEKADSEQKERRRRRTKEEMEAERNKDKK